MKISRSTKERVAHIKAEAAQTRAQLETLLVRLEEHSGTKRIARPLKVVIDKLETWRKTPHF